MIAPPGTSSCDVCRGFGLFLVRLAEPRDARAFGVCACFKGQQLRRDPRLAYLWLSRGGATGRPVVKPLEQLLEADELPDGFLALLAELTLGQAKPRLALRAGGVR